MGISERYMYCNTIWDKVFWSGLSKFCGRQPLKNLLSPLLNALPYFFFKKIEVIASYTIFKLLRKLSFKSKKFTATKEVVSCLNNKTFRAFINRDPVVQRI